MNDPIFRSVEQALHFSFLMATLPVSQKSQMHELYVLSQKRLGVFNEKSTSTIHFGGLDPLEVRGQCAMVRATVYDHLAEPERFAVLARYAYQGEKGIGVRGIRDYCLPLLACGHEWATLAMAWSLFGTEEQKAGLSIRKIAEEFVLKPSSVNDDLVKIKKTSRSLEARAYDRLGVHFANTGLIDLN